MVRLSVCTNPMRNEKPCQNWEEAPCTPVLFWFQNYNWDWQLKSPRGEKSPGGDPEIQMNLWMKAEGSRAAACGTSTPGVLQDTQNRQMGLPSEHSQSHPTLLNSVLCSMGRLWKWLKNRMPNCKDNGKLKTSPYFSFYSLPRHRTHRPAVEAAVMPPAINNERKKSKSGHGKNYFIPPTIPFSSKQV